MLAWLRCKLRRALEALRAGAPGSVAGLSEADARAYALGFLGEYLPPARLAQLAAAEGLTPLGASGAGARVGEAGGREGRGAASPGGLGLGLGW